MGLNDRAWLITSNTSEPIFFNMVVVLEQGLLSF
jgi:hypothetical protein